MDRVKQAVHYWCADTKNGSCMGQDVTVAILDSGLAPHPDFQGRVAAFQDFVEGRREAYDDNGHGTHVAGILAGDGRMSRGVFAGMAPKAKLVALKVLDHKGEGNMRQILEGICWLMKHAGELGVRVVNISVGARAGLNKEKENWLIDAVERLWDAGITVVVSAGNYGPKEGTIAIPGNSRKVITVGALGTPREGEGCSGRGPTEACVVKPDLVAPGYRIISCSNTPARYRRPYAIKSGTSMATPVVAGACAMLLSKYSDITNAEIKLKLRESCQRAETAQGWGLLDVERLLGTWYF